MKLKTVFRCTNCEYISPKWIGKCPQCEAWNSFEEDTINVGKELKEGKTPLLINETKGTLKPEKISSVLERVKTQKEVRNYNFSAPVLNNFFGNGLVAGSLTLLAGEPGLGKSTLSLQLLRALYQGKNTVTPRLLYITAEESAFELARRSERLKIPPEIDILQSNNYEQIQSVLESFLPDVVVIDSVQTISSSSVQSSPGSVTQVSTIASQLLAISKSKNISIILVGHVTKDGQIAGPKTLEHLVDSVCMIESTESPQYRTISFSKNRFGTTSQLLLLKMEETGLNIITDPSLALLENLETGIGVVYGMSIDKDLPLVVEIQCLVGKPNFAEEGKGGGFGRREASGVKTTKLNTILAIAEKYLNLNLKNQDVYLQITGLPKNTVDDSLDLPILLAILSSVRDKPVSEIYGKNAVKYKEKLIFAGRLTLSGKIRNATLLEQRTNTSEKLGFGYNPGISQGELGQLSKI
jgi:DNA repair protein RadA/Sms